MKEKNIAEMRSRTVDTDTYIPILRGIVEEGKDVRLTITGSSMLPFMADKRDSIIISKITRELKRGDMVFYQRKNGMYVMHRIYRACPCKDQYYMVGDAQKAVEGPLEREQIFGLITAVNRKGKWEKPGTFCWEFFEHVWLLMRPFRVYLLLGMLKLEKIKKAAKRKRKMAGEE